MENNVVPVLNEVAEIKNKAASYLDSLGSKLTEAQKNQFLEICVGFGLNPFKREIYAIPYGSNFNIIVGYEVYIKRAERSGVLNGWHVELFNTPDNDLGAKIVIHRKDWERPFIHEVYMSEYSQNSPLWKAKPKTMLKKVVIAQGFRMCFSCEIGGMPYTADELPLNADSADIVEPKKIENKAAKSAKSGAKIFLDKLKEQGLNASQIKEFCALNSIESNKPESFDISDDILIQMVEQYKQEAIESMPQNAPQVEFID